MKLLVASVGETLDSLIAKHFEHAAWYLFVDVETLTIDAVRNLMPHDHHVSLVRAAEENVGGVIAGKFGAGSLKRIREGKLRVACLYGITVRNLLREVSAGNVVLGELSTADEPGRMMAALPRIAPLRARRGRLTMTGFSSDSQRHHYHLQQYGGRGH